MLQRVASGPRRGKSGRGKRATDGLDNGPRQTSKSESFWSQALETTPGRKGGVFRAAMGKPMLDPKFKYTFLESTLTGSHLASLAPTALISLNQGLTDITRIGDRIRSSASR